MRSYCNADKFPVSLVSLMRRFSRKTSVFLPFCSDFERNLGSKLVKCRVFNVTYVFLGTVRSTGNGHFICSTLAGKSSNPT